MIACVLSTFLQLDFYEINHLFSVNYTFPEVDSQHLQKLNNLAVILVHWKPFDNPYFALPVLQYVNQIFPEQWIEMKFSNSSVLYI